MLRQYMRDFINIVLMRVQLVGRKMLLTIFALRNENNAVMLML